MQTYPRVVVVGAGFGGMQAAQSLARAGIEVLLIDYNNYHTFVPLLYQVAMAQLEPTQIIFPLRNAVRRSPRHLRFLMADVRSIDFGKRRIETEDDVIFYDYLVLATGSQTKYLGVAGAAEHALPMQTLEQAIVLRHRILSCVEQASRTVDPKARQRLLTFAIVGGGATGVEVAGALVELINSAFVKDYPRLDRREVRVLLVQSGDCLLQDLPEKLGRYAERHLRRMGVEIYLQAKVSQVTEGTIHLETGETIAAETVVWTAGVQVRLPEVSEDLPSQKGGKLQVRPTLQLLDHAQVYAIGDLAHFKQNGRSLDGVAPEALQQGVATARNIQRQLRGNSPLPFRYFNKGRLAIIGGFAGVGKIGPFALTGFLAWLMWLGVHLVYLPGFRNRFYVLQTWLQNYILGDRAVRFILRQHDLSASAKKPTYSRSRSKI
ncbi:MAG: NAD(P)/FAD-dependent oxidoreductase [Elainellaceae cyanobacterium]